MANRKKTTHNPAIILLAIILLAATACTRNNGDIGPWFGAWTMTSIKADGIPVADYSPSTITWKFQSTVINMIQINPHHEYINSFGTWRQISDNQLELNFSHSDSERPSGTDVYAPLPATHLPASVSLLDIVSFSSKHIVLEYTSPTDGIVYTYTLDR